MRWCRINKGELLLRMRNTVATPAHSAGLRVLTDFLREASTYDNWYTVTLVSR